MSSRAGWPPLEFPAAVHGTAVSFKGRGALLIGPSGSGKSSTALQLMCFDALLIADDLVWLDLRGGAPWLAYPPQAPRPARIEARGMGLIPFEPAPSAQLSLVIDLGTIETARLPEPAMIDVAGRPVRRIHKVDNPAFPAMVLQYLQSGFP